MSTQILLEDRGIVEVGGAEAVKFLHNLVTNDVAKLEPGEARFAALLAPQGKILVDFLVFIQDRDEGRVVLLDCPRALVGDLVRRLGIYKLRSEVKIADRSDELAVVVIPDAADRPDIEAVALARDPRAPTLGWRAIVAKGSAADGPRDLYEALRISAIVPEGGVDFAYGDAFPAEANMDRLAGVDFTKGCFVGQEVVSRMKHRGTVRTRVALFRTQGAPPAPGTKVRAGEIEIGVTGAHAADAGLALIRLDRLADAKAASVVPLADGAALEFVEAESGA